MREQKTKLSTAIDEGNLEQVKEIVTVNPAIITEKLDNLWTALVKSATQSKTKIAQYLIEAGIKNGISLEEQNIHHALIKASGTGNIALVQLLINNGADAEFCLAVDSALSTAAENNRSEIVKFLLANTNQHQVNLDHALIKAAGTGNIALGELLIKNKADAVYNLYQDSALSTAAENNKTEIVEFLLANTNQTKKHLNYALVKAAGTGNIALLTLLISNGADPQYNLSGNSALRTAARYNKPETVEFLLQKIALPQECIDEDLDEALDQALDQALIEAAGTGNIALVQLLINNGANAKYHLFFNSALIRAVVNNKTETVEFFLKHTYQPEENLDHALIKAAETGNITLTKLLITKGGNPTYSLNKYSALSTAAEENKTEIAEFLLEHTNQPQKNLDEALIKAVTKNYSLMTTILINHAKHEFFSNDKIFIKTLHNICNEVNSYFFENEAVDEDFAKYAAAISCSIEHTKEWLKYTSEYLSKTVLSEDNTQQKLGSVAYLESSQNQTKDQYSNNFRQFIHDNYKLKPDNYELKPYTNRAKVSKHVAKLMNNLEQIPNEELTANQAQLKKQILDHERSFFTRNLITKDGITALQPKEHANLGDIMDMRAICDHIKSYLGPERENETHASRVEAQRSTATEITDQNRRCVIS